MIDAWQQAATTVVARTKMGIPVFDVRVWWRALRPTAIESDGVDVCIVYDDRVLLTRQPFADAQKLGPAR